MPTGAFEQSGPQRKGGSRRSGPITASQTETDFRVDGDVVIIVGLMLGHARIEREQHVYHHRNMRVWRERQGEWKLLAWQSSDVLRG